MKRLILFSFLLINLFCANAQDTNFTASAPRVVEVGETFRLVYTLDTKGEGIEIADLDAFQILMGPSVSNSYSTQIINGVSSSSSEQSYSYILSATKTGVFTIHPAHIRVQGKVVASNSIKIEVVKANKNAEEQTSNTRNRREQAHTSSKINNENLFLTIELDKKSIFMGESVVASLKLYSRVKISNFGRSKFPSFQGFLSQEISSPDQISLNRENVNGEIYDVGVLRKLVLFPQHTGKIIIDPFELDIYVRQKAAASGSVFDDFFANYQDVKIERKSKPISLVVKELPSVNKPASYNGSVGSFTLKSSVNRDTLITNDAATLKVVIAGNGNLKLVEPLDIEFPADFEIYDPKTTQNINSTGGGTSGSINFEYVFIPRSAGTFTIPAKEFSYFDIKSHSYKTLSTQAFTIYVKKGKDIGASDNVMTSFTKEDVKLIGKDIRFIKTKHTSLSEKGKYIFASLDYYLFYIFSLITFALIIILNNRRIKNRLDIVRVKDKRASKLARKRLRKAESMMKAGDNDAFYDEILKAVWGFTSDKLNMPISSLSKDNIAEVLKSRKIDEEIIKDYIGILDSCEFARYSPAGSSSDLNHLYDRVSDLLTKLS